MNTSRIFVLLVLSFVPLCSGEPGTPGGPVQIIPRSQWKALPVIESEIPREAMVAMGKVAFVTIHQTESATPADDLASEEDAMRRLQRLLQDGKLDPATGRRINRMGDIAYHYLIMPSGRVYEGRSAEFQTNSNTSYLDTRERLGSPRYSRQESEVHKEAAPWGGVKATSKVPRPGAVAGHLCIAFVGDYTRQLPPKAALDSFVRLLADLLYQHRLTVNDVLMHRELARTDCPGEPLYFWLRNPPENPKPGEYGLGEGLSLVRAALSLKAAVRGG
jgi:hypothetical protein